LKPLKLLVSANSELLRHLACGPFRGLDTELLMVSGGLHAIDLAARVRPAAVLLDAELGDVSGYEAARAIKHADPACRVVLIVSRPVTARQMRMVAECGCDEVLLAPAGADALFDVLAAQLALPRRAAVRHAADLAVRGRHGQRPLRGRIRNLSSDGARLSLSERVEEGARLLLEVQPDGEPPIPVEARVVWAWAREQSSTAGVSFDEAPPEARRQLGRLTRWDIIQGADRTRVVLRGDITEATRLPDLAPALFGKVDFDMSQVSYLDTIGLSEWIQFLDELPVRDYEFHACSIAFAVQASLVDGVLGRGAVVSFYAPYACRRCDHREERLLQTAAVRADGSRRPPVFGCSRCDGSLVLDDYPERYFAFLYGARVA
jgi:DNA-binding NarL/FixJ family response regulator